MDVFIDMDSTMNDFAIGYINYYNKFFGTDYVIKHNDLTSYEVSLCFPHNDRDKAAKIRERIFSTPGFWIDIPIQPNVIETVKWINENFNTYILTAPWILYKDCPKEKYMWIEKYLPFISLEKVIFCHDKHVIKDSSILIDDNPKYLESFKGETVKINYPYNKDTATHYSADNWIDVLDIMKTIKGKK